MRRMVSLLQLGVGVVLLCTVVVVPAASQQWCNRVHHDNYGCPTFILVSPGGGRCQVATQGSPNFSFYLRPGTTFTSLQIKLTWHLGSPTTIYIGRDVLGQRNKWYHVQMTSHESLVHVTYDILIDGQKQRSHWSVSNAHTFDIYTIGSPYYASDCNPSNYPPPPPPPPTTTTTPPPPPPPPPTTTTRPAPTPPPSPVQSTDDAVNHPGMVIVFPTVLPSADITTKNGEAADEDSSTEDSSKPEEETNEAKTGLILGLPWHIVVIVGVIAAAVVTIFTAALVIKKRKKEEKDSNSLDQETGSFPLSFSGSQNYDEHDYDNIDDPEDHIYEEVNDLGPVAGVGRPCSAGEGVDASVGGGWVDRRGSAHDSENSLYVGLPWVYLG